MRFLFLHGAVYKGRRRCRGGEGSKIVQKVPKGSGEGGVEHPENIPTSFMDGSQQQSTKLEEIY